MRIGRTIPPTASPIYIRDIINGIKGLIRGQAEIERFRSELKDHYGVKHCFLVSSGKAAFTLILKALHDLHPERDEVLIPAFICYSVPSAIVRAGLKVKLSDVDPDTLDFNYDQLKELLSKYHHRDTESTENISDCHFPLRPAANDKATDSPWQQGPLKKNKKPNQPINQSTNQPDASTDATNKQQTTHNLSNEIHANGKRSEFHRDRHPGRKLLAVISAHLFGLPVDVSKVLDMVADSAVTVIEDAAQVLGSTWQDKKLGTLGDVGFFSLGRGKAMSTVEGGIIITDRDDIAKRIKTQLLELPKYSISELIKLISKALILAPFQHPAFFWIPKSLLFLRIGGTFYDPEFKIRKLSAFQAGLAKNWKKKLDTFQKHRHSASQQWKSILKSSSIQSYSTKNGYVPDMLRFPVRITDNWLWKNILAESDQEGNGIMFTYPDSVNGIDKLKEMFYGQTYPVAEKLPHQLVTLPIHSYVSQKDIIKIAKQF